METIRTFDELTQRLSGLTGRCRVAVVWGTDDATLTAAARAMENGFADFTFVGGGPELLQTPQLSPYATRLQYKEAGSPEEAARLAVDRVRHDQADILMKGLVSSDILLRCILNREHGLLPAGRVLTHVAVVEIPHYDRLLAYTDAAVIPYPTDDQRRAQVGYVARVCRSLGLETPRISLIHCSEKADSRHFPHTASYATLKEEARRGDFGPCIVDGPLDVRTSCDARALHVKHILSPIDGRADALVFPDIEAANTFHKTITCFCHAEAACLLQGPTVPVVMPSRGDDADTKYYSLALAALTRETLPPSPSV